MTELVHYDLEDGVARLTLDSPHNRNALSSQLTAELHESVRAALADPNARVVVLTGTGPVFCSGADLKEQRARNAPPAGARDGSSGQGEEPAGRDTAPNRPGLPTALIDVLTMLWDASKPVVCRVNGPARAGGLGIIGACDIVIARETATFGFAEVRVGVVPAVVAVTCMPRMTQRASLEYFLTGEAFDARRAVEIGMVNRAVPDDELDAEIDRYVKMLLLGAPGAQADIKKITETVPSLTRDEAFRSMLELSLARFASEEGVEGMRAFLEKRKPRWVT
ncbi:MAG: enoyl-CoA hydratase [Nitriliruptorales bacterium]|nr:enoyl-CoA hydratase [Nitriliruptorales bacterium]